MRVPGARDSRNGIVALLAAEAISTLGSRMSMLAIPWLVLVTTGDPLRVGLVAGAEMLPYVLSGVLAAPLQDRLGARRTAIIADLASVGALGLIIVGHSAFPLLLVVVAIAGALRAQADRSKNNLLKPLMDLSGTDYARITSAHMGIMRTANLVGASLGGVAIAVFGPIGALWLDAATFAVCGVLVLLAVPDVAVTTPDSEPYFTALRNGFAEFRKDRLLRDFTGLLAVTNVFAQASTVIFVPLWVFTTVKSPVALGVVSVTYALGSIVGNALFTAAAPYLSRYRTVATGFLLGGAPTLLVLAVSDSPVVVGAVTFVCGFAMSSVTPTFGAMIFQRVPSGMLARVGGIIAAITYIGLPLGGLFGGWLISQFGLADGLLVASLLLLVATLVPVVRRPLWVELNAPVRPVGYRAFPFGLRVTLSYIDGEWTAHGRRGLRVFMKRRGVPARVVMKGFDQLEVPELHEALGRVVTRDLSRAQEAEQDLRAALRAKELAIASITAHLERRQGP